MSSEDALRAIDAEIDKAVYRISLVRASSDSETASAIESSAQSYIDGLAFARKLIISLIDTKEEAT